MSCKSPLYYITAVPPLVLERIPSRDRNKWSHTNSCGREILPLSKGKCVFDFGRRSPTCIKYVFPKKNWCPASGFEHRHSYIVCFYHEYIGRLIL